MIMLKIYCASGNIFVAQSIVKHILAYIVIASPWNSINKICVDSTFL